MIGFERGEMELGWCLVEPLHGPQRNRYPFGAVMREYGRTPNRAAAWHELVRFPGKKTHGSKEYGGARQEVPADEEEFARGDVSA